MSKRGEVKDQALVDTRNRMASNEKGKQGAVAMVFNLARDFRYVRNGVGSAFGQGSSSILFDSDGMCIVPGPLLNM